MNCKIKQNRSNYSVDFAAFVSDPKYQQASPKVPAFVVKWVNTM